MNKKNSTITLGTILMSLVLCLFTSLAYAKKSSVPLQLDYIIESTENNVTTTLLEVTALTSLQQVKITVAPYKNMELLSVEKETTFNEVVKGQILRFKIQTRRNNNADVAYLSVGLHAFRENDSARHSMLSIRYGEIQQVEAVYKSVAAPPGSGPMQERTIKMPASLR